MSATFWNSIRIKLLHRPIDPYSNIYLKNINKCILAINGRKPAPKESSLNSIIFFLIGILSLEEMQPDIIVAHGGGIVPTEMIKCAKDHTCNLHRGVSPFYSGYFCTPFCILNSKIFNIGVTIHEFSLNIDGGAIYGDGRP